MKRLLSLLLMLLAFATVKAQGDVEYRAEIGAGAGLVAYEGDFNGSVLKNQQPIASVIFRRLFNPRSGLKISGSYGKLKGSSKNADTYYIDFADQPYGFNSSLADVSIVYEYNLWPYGTGREYRGAKPLVPYLAIGLGATYASADNDTNSFAVNMPIGIGLKYKIADRLNLGIEWTMHFSGSDKLDGIADPYYVKSNGIFKNTDCYSALQLSLTYSFMAKCRTCHNADE
ncbi:MAG: outer membrane beta-barrel protein [Prevotella sp.]|nr:outer membrane beta-barrel protein [Prevotella sp.]